MLLAPLVVLHFEVLKLKDVVAGYSPAVVTIGRPENPSCSLSVEAASDEIALILNGRVWGALLACQAEYDRRAGGEAPEGTPL